MSYNEMNETLNKLNATHLRNSNSYLKISRSLGMLQVVAVNYQKGTIKHVTRLVNTKEELSAKILDMVKILA